MEVIASPTYFHFPLQEWQGGTPTAIWPAADASGTWTPPPSIIAPKITETNTASPLILVATRFAALTALTPVKLPE